MHDIAGQGRVDTQSVIDYIIQGIPDEVANKAILYGARNMQQLKERFKQYEAMKSDVAALDKPNITTRHKLVSDDGSAVVNVNRLANCPVFASRLSGHKLKYRT